MFRGPSLTASAAVSSSRPFGGFGVRRGWKVHRRFRIARAANTHTDGQDSQHHSMQQERRRPLGMSSPGPGSHTPAHRARGTKHPVVRTTCAPAALLQPLTLTRRAKGHCPGRSVKVTWPKYATRRRQARLASLQSPHGGPVHKTREAAGLQPHSSRPELSARWAQRP